MILGFIFFRCSVNLQSFARQHSVAAAASNVPEVAHVITGHTSKVAEVGDAGIWRRLARAAAGMIGVQPTSRGSRTKPRPTVGILLSGTAASPVRASRDSGGIRSRRRPKVILLLVRTMSARTPLPILS